MLKSLQNLALKPNVDVGITPEETVCLPLRRSGHQCPQVVYMEDTQHLYHDKVLATGLYGTHSETSEDPHEEWTYPPKGLPVSTTGRPSIAKRPGALPLSIFGISTALEGFVHLPGSVYEKDDWIYADGSEICREIWRSASCASSLSCGFFGSGTLIPHVDDGKRGRTVSVSHERAGARTRSHSGGSSLSRSPLRHFRSFSCFKTAETDTYIEDTITRLTVVAKTAPALLIMIEKNPVVSDVPSDIEYDEFVDQLGPSLLLDVDLIRLGGSRKWKRTSVVSVGPKTRDIFRIA